MPKLLSVVSSFKMFTYIKWRWSRSVVPDSLRPHGLYLPDSSNHGIFQARLLEWVAFQFHLFLEKPDILRYSLVVFYTWCITVMWNLLHHCPVFSSVQFSPVAQLCLTLCSSMDCSTPGLPVHHQLPEFTQTHVHWVSDAIQTSHPLSFPSCPSFNLSQHQGHFQWVSSSYHVAKGVSASALVLPMNIQDWFPLGLTSLISLQSKGLSRVFSNTTVQKHQVFTIQLSL